MGPGPGTVSDRMVRRLPRLMGEACPSSRRSNLIRLWPQELVQAGEAPSALPGRQASRIPSLTKVAKTAPYTYCAT